MYYTAKMAMEDSMKIWKYMGESLGMSKHAACEAVESDLHYTGLRVPPLVRFDYCPACAYATINSQRADQKRDCDICPIKWVTTYAADHGNMPCLRWGSPYLAWADADMGTAADRAAANKVYLHIKKQYHATYSTQITKPICWVIAGDHIIAASFIEQHKVRWKRFEPLVFSDMAACSLDKPHFFTLAPGWKNLDKGIIVKLLANGTHIDPQ